MPAAELIALDDVFSTTSKDELKRHVKAYYQSVPLEIFMQYTLVGNPDGYVSNDKLAGLYIEDWVSHLHALLRLGYKFAGIVTYSAYGDKKREWALLEEERTVLAP